MSITLTDRAAAKITKLFHRHRAGGGACLRVGIESGGCEGFSYRLDVAEAPAGDDEVFESLGVRIVCDAGSLAYLKGTEIDYRDDPARPGFVFNNPNAKEGCECGGSFSV